MTTQIETTETSKRDLALEIITFGKDLQRSRSLIIATMVEKMNISKYNAAYYYDRAFKAKAPKVVEAAVEASMPTVESEVAAGRKWVVDVEGAGFYGFVTRTQAREFVKSIKSTGEVKARLVIPEMKEAA